MLPRLKRFWYIAPRRLYFQLAVVCLYLPFMWLVTIALATADMTFDFIFLKFADIKAPTVVMYRFIHNALCWVYPAIKAYPVLSHALTALALYPSAVGHYIVMKPTFLWAVHPWIAARTFSYDNIIVYPLTSYWFAYCLFHTLQGFVFSWWYYPSRALECTKADLNKLLAEDEELERLYSLHHPDKGYMDLVLIALVSYTAWYNLPTWKYLTAGFHHIYAPFGGWRRNLFPWITFSLFLQSLSVVYMQLFRRLHYKHPISWKAFPIALLLLFCAALALVLYWQWMYYFEPMKYVPVGMYQRAHWMMFYNPDPFFRVILPLFGLWLLRQLLRRRFKEVLLWRDFRFKRYKSHGDLISKISTVRISRSERAAQHEANLAKRAAAPAFDKSVLLKHPSALKPDAPHTAEPQSGESGTAQ